MIQRRTSTRCYDIAAVYEYCYESRNWVRDHRGDSDACAAVWAQRARLARPVVLLTGVVLVNWPDVVSDLRELDRLLT